MRFSGATAMIFLAFCSGFFAGVRMIWMDLPDGTPEGGKLGVENPILWGVFIFFGILYGVLQFKRPYEQYPAQTSMVACLRESARAVGVGLGLSWFVGFALTAISA